MSPGAIMNVIKRAREANRAIPLRQSERLLIAIRSRSNWPEAKDHVSYAVAWAFDAALSILRRRDMHDPMVMRKKYRSHGGFVSLATKRQSRLLPTGFGVMPANVRDQTARQLYAALPDSYFALADRLEELGCGEQFILPLRQYSPK